MPTEIDVDLGQLQHKFISELLYNHHMLELRDSSLQGSGSFPLEGCSHPPKEVVVQPQTFEQFRIELFAQQV